MREYARKNESQSRTLDSNPKASRQASIDVILRQYQERNIQRYAENESEELIQGKFESDTQTEQQPVQREEKPNNTGLPDNLKTGIENLSGYSMDDVQVHYKSDKPAQLNALAYAQGTNIHVAPGQEKHLPHEVWHVVQQKQGRVRPTMQVKEGVPINDDKRLEHEADIIGKKALTAQLESIDLNAESPYRGVAQLAPLSVENPNSGLVPLKADIHEGNDLYMWNVDYTPGQEPSDTIGSANLFTDWAGAQLVTDATFHRAHAYGKQFGGVGDRRNVAWWTEAAEAQWTPFDDKIRGDNNAGYATGWKPGIGEKGNYKVTRMLHPVMDIRTKYKTRLVSACQWGLDAGRDSFQAMLNELANETQQQEAEDARQYAFDQIETTIDALLNIINIDTAAELIINNMTISYTRTDVGTEPGAARADIGTTQVNNTLTIDDFGLIADDEQVWNALSTFGGMFGKGKQVLTQKFTKRLAVPKISEQEIEQLRAMVIEELQATTPTSREIGLALGKKIKVWQGDHRGIELGPIGGGWGIRIHQE